MHTFFGNAGRTGERAEDKSYNFGLRVESIWLYTGTTRQLYVYRGSQRVTRRIQWSSSNPMAATVDKKGLLIPVDTGTTTITAAMPGGTSVSIGVSVVPVKIIGHRGMKTHAPQNTAVSVEIAAEAGCWGVEVDVWETGEDQTGKTGFILGHEKNIQSMTGVDANITELSQEALSRIPVTSGINADKYHPTLCTLDQLLDTCKKYGLIPFIDIKKKHWSAQAVERMIDTLYEKELLEKVRFVSSKMECFHSLKEYSEKKYHITPKIQMNVREGTYGGMTVMEQLCMGKENGYYGYSLYHDDVSAEVSRYVRENDMILTLWTLKEKNKKKFFEYLKKYNIESVMVEGVF